MDSFNPLISVIIPTYNRENIIVNTINSVLKQTYSNFELLIIDDASTDNTEQKINEIKDKRIKYIKLPTNTKGTKPRNVGIKLSQGDFIAFLDSDDCWLPDKLEKQIKFIYNSGLYNKNLLCFTGVIFKDKEYCKEKLNKPLYKDEDIMDYILVRNNTVQTSTFMVTSSIAKKTLFDSNLKRHQDWDFCIRLRNNNTNFLYLPDCLTIYNIDNSFARIGNTYKNEEVSLKWLERRKDDLSIKAQWAFKVKTITNFYIQRKERKKALKTLVKAYFYQGINHKIFIKYLIKLILTNKSREKIKRILYKLKVK